MVDPTVRPATSSPDGMLALRRVERQQALIERLHAARGQRVALGKLARELNVSVRTVARDVERLRQSGVPLTTHQGPHGGVSLDAVDTTVTVVLDLSEAAALMSSLAVLGPTATLSAASTMRKLVHAVNPARDGLSRPDR